MNKTFKAFLFLSATQILMYSCVNDKYDLTKIDKEINFQVNSSIPLGSSKLFTIGDYVKDDNGLLSVAKNGDLYFVMNGSQFSAEFEVRNTGFATSSFEFKTVTLNYNNPYYGAVLSVPDTKIELRDFPEYNIHLNSEQRLTEGIVNLREVELNSDVHILFSINAGSIYLNKGIKIAFPQYLDYHINETDASFLKKEADNSLEFIADKKIDAGNKLDIVIHIDRIDFTKFPENQGIVNSIVKLDDNIPVSGVAPYIRTSDFSSALPQKISLVNSFDISAFDIVSATGIFNPNIKLDDQLINLKEIPEILKRKETVTDFSALRLLVNVNNESPLSLSLNADIKSFKDNETIHELHLGKTGDSQELIIPGSTIKDFCISEDGKYVPENYDRVDVKGLNSLLFPIPDSIKIENIECRSSQEPVKVSRGESYKLIAEYQINTPVSFGENFSIADTLKIKGWNKSLNGGKVSYKVKGLIVEMDIANTLPLGLKAEFHPVDIEGKEITEIKITGDSEIRPGSVTNPSYNHINLNMDLNEGALQELDGLKILLHVKTDSDHAGIVLNREQGVRIEKSSAKINGNVDAKL